MKTISDTLKEIFREVDRPLTLLEIYLIIFRTGHPNNTTTKDSVRSIIRHFMDANKVKRVAFSTYVRNNV